MFWKKHARSLKIQDATEVRGRFPELPWIFKDLACFFQNIPNHPSYLG